MADSDIPLPPIVDQVAWLIQHPREVRDAIKLLNLLANLQIEVVTPDAARTLGGNKPTLQISDINAVAPIPLKFGAPWGVPTGSPSRASFDASASTSPGVLYAQAEAAAVSTRLTQTRAVLAALILDLQSTGQAGTS